MQQVPTNPPTPTTDVSIAPTPNMQYFTIDYINAINGSAGPRGAQQAVITQVLLTATCLDIGPLGNSNTEQTFCTEVDSVDVSDLQARVRALGTYDGINLSSATVTAKDLYISV